MELYHELSASSLRFALQNGVTRESRGEKGNDEAIIKSDKFLDANRPLSVKQAGLSRANNVYAYLGSKLSLIDIRDGETVPLQDYANKKTTRLLRFHVDPRYCFVSDLDLYDTVKLAIGHGKAVVLTELAAQYWHAVIPLRAFKLGEISRPEIMITRDVDAGEITVVDKDSP